MKINPIVYLILGVFLLGALFFIFQSQKQTNNPQNTTQTITPSQQTSTNSAHLQSNSKNFELVIKDKKLVSGPETIQVTQGDEVIIKVTVDEDEEFHLHGYDKSVDLEKDKPAQLQFTANLTGRFPYELEKSKTDIGALEVSPK